MSKRILILLVILTCLLSAAMVSAQDFDIVTNTPSETVTPEPKGGIEESGGVVTATEVPSVTINVVLPEEQTSSTIPPVWYIPDHEQQSNIISIIAIVMSAGTIVAVVIFGIANRQSPAAIDLEVARRLEAMQSDRSHMSMIERQYQENPTVRGIIDALLQASTALNAGLQQLSIQSTLLQQAMDMARDAKAPGAENTYIPPQPEPSEDDEDDTDDMFGVAARP